MGEENVHTLEDSKTMTEESSVGWRELVPAKIAITLVEHSRFFGPYPQDSPQIPERIPDSAMVHEMVCWI